MNCLLTPQEQSWWGRGTRLRLCHTLPGLSREHHSTAVCVPFIRTKLTCIIFVREVSIAWSNHILWIFPGLQFEFLCSTFCLYQQDLSLSLESQLAWGACFPFFNVPALSLLSGHMLFHSHPELSAWVTWSGCIGFYCCLHNSANSPNC